MFIDSQKIVSVSHRILVATRGGHGMPIPEAKANWDKVISLWTCNLPTFPDHCSPDQSVFADTASSQEISFDCCILESLGQDSFKNT